MLICIRRNNRTWSCGICTTAETSLLHLIRTGVVEFENFDSTLPRICRFRTAWHFWKHRCLHGLLATLVRFLRDIKQMRVFGAWFPFLIRVSLQIKTIEVPKACILGDLGRVVSQIALRFETYISHRDGIQSEIKWHCWTLVNTGILFFGYKQCR